MQLRDYQQECINKIKESFLKGKNSLLINLPTGSGKTKIFCHYIIELNLRTLILVPTIELIYQTIQTLHSINTELKIGIVNKDNKDFYRKIVISTYAAAKIELNERRLIHQDFSCLIADEAHLANSEGCNQLFQRLGFGENISSAKILIGFSATIFPALYERFKTLVFQKSIKELVEGNFLVKPVGYKILNNIDLSQVAIQDGDFVECSLSQVVDTPFFTNMIVDSWLKKVKNKRTLVFTLNVQAAINLAKTFRTRGIAAQCVHADTPDELRAEILNDFRNGSLKVITNCNVFATGLDIPETECIIPSITLSRVRWTQQVGRGLRKCDYINKSECIIFDFNSRNYGLHNTQSLENVTPRINNRKKYLKELPKKLNIVLKEAYIEYVVLHVDLLNTDFFWYKKKNIFYVKGILNSKLEVIAGLSGYTVIYYDSYSFKTLADGLSFEDAFKVAENFLRQNYTYFTDSDKSKHKDKPITNEQKSFFENQEYYDGVDDLTSYQAQAIICMLI